MNEFQPLIDQLYREKVQRARRQTPAERMSDCLELASLHFSKGDEEMRRRLRIVREMEERGCYGPPVPRL
ncbi:MAG: hypothetical protein M3463_10190 [Verrucomicrobiota bacterium]|nr:hypothetical protein [Verrucomicrobiota bacterium]